MGLGDKYEDRSVCMGRRFAGWLAECMVKEDLVLHVRLSWYR